MAVGTPSNQVHSEWDRLRQQLKQLNVWPDAGDELLALLPLSQWQPTPTSAADREWLPRVVEDTLNGRDIGSHHPAFFQKLLTNADLRRDFLEKLEIGD